MAPASMTRINISNFFSGGSFTSTFKRLSTSLTPCAPQAARSAHDRAELAG
jgi:hypothetical protein